MFRYSSDTMRSPIDCKIKKKPLKSYSCDLCEHSKWQNETDVEIHRKEVHKHALYKSLSDRKNHFCRICVRQFTDSAAVLRHIKSIHFLSSPIATRIEREIFICEYCDNIFFNKRLLSAHISHTHSSKSRRYLERVECPVCLKVLKLQTVWSHFLYHKIPSVSTCQICLRTCENKSEMYEHLKSHPFYYNCDVCGFQTKYSVTYYEHITTHRTKTVKDNKLSNAQVKEYYASRLNVAWKYELDPSGLKGLRVPRNIKICVLCREICTGQGGLKDHVLRDHCIEEESKKKHRCTCGEEFFNNVLLKHHIFKMKGDHRVDEYEEITNDDEEFILKRQEVPIAYGGVHKERVTERNIDPLNLSESEEVGIVNEETKYIVGNDDVNVNEQCIEGNIHVVDNFMVHIVDESKVISP